MTYMSLVANWSYPTAIRFGAGRIAEIGEACASRASRSRCWSPTGACHMEITSARST
jgi:hypothetical protein